MTRGRSLWTYYPAWLVKIIFKTELFKISGNGPECVQQLKKHFFFSRLSNNSGENRNNLFQPWLLLPYLLSDHNNGNFTLGWCIWDAGLPPCQGAVVSSHQADDISVSHPGPQLPAAEVQFLASVSRRLGLPSPTQPSLVGPMLGILRMLEPRLPLFVRQK